jgi:hypothetical protein
MMIPAHCFLSPGELAPNSTLFVTAFESLRGFRKHKRAGLSAPSRTVEINWACSRQSFLRASKEGLLVILGTEIKKFALLSIFSAHDDYRMNDPARKGLMFYFSQTGPSIWGANLPGSSILASNDTSEHLTEFVVAVQRWSDGTEGRK